MGEFPRKTAQIGLQRAAVGKSSRCRACSPSTISRVSLPVCTRTQRLYLTAQHRRAALIQLYRHQSRREFDDVRFQPQLAQGVGCFQPE